MNVHGIYDTSATMHTFESRGEFQSYLQQEAGVSGSYFGFYAGAKKAWGNSVSAAQLQYMSVLDVDVDRWDYNHSRCDERVFPTIQVYFTSTGTASFEPL